MLLISVTFYFISPHQFFTLDQSNPAPYKTLVVDSGAICQQSASIIIFTLIYRDLLFDKLSVLKLISISAGLILAGYIVIHFTQTLIKKGLMKF